MEEMFAGPDGSGSGAKSDLLRLVVPHITRLGHLIVPSRWQRGVQQVGH